MLTLLAITTLSLSNPSGPEALAPNLSVHGKEVWMTWIAPHEDGITNEVMCSTFSDGAWSPASTVVKAGHLFVNWADFPELCVAKDGSVYVTWLQKSGPGTYAYDIGVARSTDDGKTWSHLGTLNDDRVLGEHGFVSLVQEGERGVRAFWLDGRAMTGDGHSGHGGGDMQLRSAVIDSVVHPSELIDERVCECCSTDAVLHGGVPLVVYRDRGASEIRDIAITMIGKKEKLVNPDGWNINGCPVNGPAIATNNKDVIVGWFTEPEMKSAVKVSFVDADGIQQPIQLSTNTIGRVDVEMLEDSTGIACWLETCEDGVYVAIAKVSKDGAVSQVQHIEKVASSRQAGFPHIAVVGDQLLIAWTAVDTANGIQTKVIDLDSF